MWLTWTAAGFCFPVFDQWRPLSLMAARHLHLSVLCFSCCSCSKVLHFQGRDQDRGQRRLGNERRCYVGHLCQVRSKSGNPFGQVVHLHLNVLHWSCIHRTHQASQCLDPGFHSNSYDNVQHAVIRLIIKRWDAVVYIKLSRYAGSTCWCLGRYSTARPILTCSLYILKQIGQ